MPAQSTTKRCTRCDFEKPLEEFCRDNRRPDGRGSWCKPCRNTEKKRRYDVDSSDQKEYSRRYYYENDGRARAAMRYRTDPDFKEAATAAARKWQDANPDKRREYRRRHRLRHHGERAAYLKGWRDRNRAQYLDQRKRSYYRNRAARVADAAMRVARRKGAPGWATPEQIAARFELWGWQCWLGLDGCTGDAGTVDHVIAVSRGGTNWPANLRPACKKCNNRKHARDWRVFVSRPKE